MGRLALEISRILQGKDKPTYNPKHNMGDVVIVVNAAHVHFTNDQWQSKLYRWHTGGAWLPQWREGPGWRQAQSSSSGQRLKRELQGQQGLQPPASC